MNRAIPYLVLLVGCLSGLDGRSATYYISPNGSDVNAGTVDKPWLTFSHALNAQRAWCGNTLVLLDGTYGVGTSTERLRINAAVCTRGNELIVRAHNQRKAKAFTGGTGISRIYRSILTSRRV